MSDLRATPGTELVRTTTPEVVPAGQRSLEELAEIANRGYAAYEDALLEVANSVSRARQITIDIGAALLEAHKRFPRKADWNRWCLDNLGFGYLNASRFERVAYFDAEIPDEIWQPIVGAQGRVIQPSLNRAVCYLASVGMPRIPALRQIDDSDRSRIIQLNEAGIPHVEIARLFGIKPHSVRYIVSPNWRAQMKAQAKRAYQRRAMAAEALAKAEEQRAQMILARKVGGDIGESYSLTRRVLQRLERAAVSASNAEQRAAIRVAQTALHQAEDQITRALKAAT